MKATIYRRAACIAAAGVLLAGCTATEKGTVAGTLVGAGLGAGTGAIIGHQTGHAGAGTAIGAGIGAPVGAAVGYAIGRAEDAHTKAEQARQPVVVAAPPPPPHTPPAANTRVVTPQAVSEQRLIPCHNCGVRLDVTDFTSGAQVRCPDCGAVNMVP